MRCSFSCLPPSHPHSHHPSQIDDVYPFFRCDPNRLTEEGQPGISPSRSHAFSLASSPQAFFDSLPAFRPGNPSSSRSPHANPIFHGFTAEGRLFRGLAFQRPRVSVQSLPCCSFVKQSPAAQIQVMLLSYGVSPILFCLVLSS